MAEEEKRDAGDVFRNTRMKFNEKADEKKLRMKRCLKALKDAGIGRPSEFVGLEVGKPVNIEWNQSSSATESVDATDLDNADIMIEKMGSVH